MRLVAALLLLVAVPAAAETTRTVELLGPVAGVIVDAGPGLRYYALGTAAGRFDATPRALALTARALTFTVDGLTLACPLASSARTTERGVVVTTERRPASRTSTRLAWRSRTIRALPCTLTVGTDAPVSISARYEALTLTESTHAISSARLLPAARPRARDRRDAPR